MDYSNEEMRLLDTLKDPGTHERFLNYLDSLGLLPSFFAAMDIRE